MSTFTQQGVWCVMADHRPLRRFSRGQSCELQKILVKLMTKNKKFLPAVPKIWFFYWKFSIWTRPTNSLFLTQNCSTKSQQWRNIRNKVFLASITQSKSFLRRAAFFDFLPHFRPPMRCRIFSAFLIGWLCRIFVLNLVLNFG